MILSVQKSHRPECPIIVRAPRGVLGRGVGSVQAGALAPQIPSVYARSYIRLDLISRAYRARESHRPLEKKLSQGKYFVDRSACRMTCVFLAQI